MQSGFGVWKVLDYVMEFMTVLVIEVDFLDLMSSLLLIEMLVQDGTAVSCIVQIVQTTSNLIDETLFIIRPLSI